MTLSPWHRDRDCPLDYYVMLPHAADATRGLLIRDGQAWTLPHFTPDATDFRLVHHINGYMSAQYGLDAVVHRCVAHAQDPDRGRQYRVYALENLSSTSRLPDGGQWVNRESLNQVPIAIPAHREIMHHWLQEAESQTASAGRAPWTHTGWFDEASAWLRAQLQRLHINMLGPLVQERAWALSCIMRVETSIGNVYFKAVPSFMAQEAAVLHEVSRQHPDLLPPPLVTDVGRGWMLMPDFGGDPLIHTPDLRRWEDVLQICARMQVAQAAHVHDWLALGVPDRGLHQMVALIDPLITVSTQIFRGPGGLSEADIEGLRALSMLMKLRCANLAGYGVPHTLVHGDLGGNILVRDDRYIVFDWTDVCIAHPFFEMATIIDTVFDASVIKTESEVRTRLRDAYLQPWTAYETMERLVQAFELSTSLGVLHQAMSYMWILMNVAEDARWELEHGLLIWLRRLLRVVE